MRSGSTFTLRPTWQLRPRIASFTCASRPIQLFAHKMAPSTDAPAAEKTTEGLPPVGVLQGLRGFTTMIPPNPRGPEEPRLRPTEGELPGMVPWDRFQTLTGIQFFFRNVTGSGN